MVRKPIVAGQFYEADAIKLQNQISQSFLHEMGPGKLPLMKRNKKAIGIISPHAGYFFSGPGAAWGYAEAAESEFPDCYILLGLSHEGYKSCVSLEDWETPFGLVTTDNEFGARLVKNSGSMVNEAAHQHEHSIEVQLPFLQFINKSHLDKLRVVPVMISPDRDYKEVALALKKTIDELHRKVCVIASSDFTHFGMNYGYVPFTSHVKENMYNLDKNAIEFVKEFDASGFLEYTEETGATICGKYPIAVCVELCRLLGAKKVRLLKYYTSGDIVQDYSNAVGYASIVFE